MKIAILHDDFPPEHMGGAGAIAASTALGYLRAGHDVLVIAATQDHMKAGRDTYEGLVVERIYSQYPPSLRGYLRFYNPQTVPRVRALLAAFGPHIVHAHGVHTHLSYYSLVLGKRLGARVYLTAHDVLHFYHRKLTDFINFNDIAIPDSFDYRVSVWRQVRELKLRYNPFKNWLTRRMLARIDGVIAVSYALKAALEQNGIRVRAVVHNGIDTKTWRAARPGYNTVLYSGDMSSVKGGPQTLAAMDRVVTQMPAARLSVVGRVTQALPSYAQALGWRSGELLRTAYAAAALVVVPSVCFDSFPTVVLEAMASAKPVIATCFGGAREAVEDGVTGYVINPLDTERYEALVVRLLNDHALAQRMGEAGRARIEREFSLEKQVQEYLEIFSI